MMPLLTMALRMDYPDSGGNGANRISDNFPLYRSVSWMAVSPVTLYLLLFFPVLPQICRPELFGMDRHLDV